MSTSVNQPTVYFYPHTYLRDFQLDVARNWPADRALNREDLARRRGAQVSRAKALNQRQRRSWQSTLPLINLKRRPKGLPKDVAVYVWGGLMLSGPFLIELENPYATTGYNVRAVSLYRPIIRRLLLSPRCLQIRCWSQACREGLRALFGEDCYQKARVCYAPMPVRMTKAPERQGDLCRFVFVSLHFEAKGGAALLRAFRTAYAQNPRIQLDLITHLPAEYQELADHPGIRVHGAKFTREEVGERFFGQCDVLIHPTYNDSFGMVVLEALSYGMAIIASDLYAIPEMVHHEVNGFLVKPPVSIWNGVVASRYFDVRPTPSKQQLLRIDTSAFEEQMAASILALAGDRARRDTYRQASLDLFRTCFAHTC